MEKIVEKGIKIDLHIHSVYSKNKDGEKVAQNTLQNLSVLVKGLIDNEVELCAITDHDTFNLQMYESLKNEEQKDNCIKKVLPGIEFSVEFLENKVIHIVTIFDDEDFEKIKNIEKIMSEGIGKTNYKKANGAYTKQGYFEILNEIGTDFIMIAHQKKTISSQNKPHANDVMSLGKATFNELVFMDYFDAYEFRNKKNEIYNKVFLMNNSLEDNLRFLTGSDCHNWVNYPYTNENEKSQFIFTFIKSLPTFKGLAMAVTDHHRISLVDKFFNPIENFKDEILIELNGQMISIPLSKGVNVIIGDNSIGKSLFLNEITGNYKLTDRGLRNGYQKYLERNKFEIKTVISEDEIFMFNRQGEIRDIFDNDGMKSNLYLSQFYPEKINVVKYRTLVENELEKLFKSLETKFEYDNEVKKLPVFKIADIEIVDKSITFVEKTKKKNTRDLQNLVDGFGKGINELEQVSNSKVLTDSDRMHITTTIEMLELMVEKYKGDLDKYKAENEKINIFNTFMNNYRQNYAKRITDEQAVYSDFIEAKNDAIQNICRLVNHKKELKEFEANIQEFKIEPETNSVDKYKFVSKLEVEKIDNNYVKEVINSVLRKGKEINSLNITELELKTYIKNYPADEDEMKVLDAFKLKISAKLDKDFKVRNTIIEDSMDVFEELSSGFDAQMYFTLISGETRNKGIYLIDQPEDHISQKAIKEKVLDEFRRMGQNRQVIMVTHNPQFIVNLDVDNVIFLAKEEGELIVRSGALEYEDENYNILKIVADNIEGGLQTILGRMKRYEKNVQVE